MQKMIIVIAGLFNFENNKYIKINDFFADNINNIANFVETINKKIIFVGNGSIAYKDVIKSILKDNAIFIDKDSPKHKLNATSIGYAAYDKYKNGEYVDSYHLSPLYLRKSSAERLLEDKNK